MIASAPRWVFNLLLLGAGSVLSVGPATAQGAPKDGREIVERMRKAYAKTWYQNLTFVQTTKIDRAGTAPVDQTWYESMAAPGFLRIDIADPDSGNGALYTKDSTFVLKAGEVVRRRPGGNPFLPLILGAYVQEPDTTVRDLMAYHFDLSKVMVVGSGASAVWVVGTTTEGDTLSPQFWVEPQRLVVTRIIAEVAPNFMMDAELGGYVPVGKAWLATHVAIGLPNGTRQEESYHDWRANRSLPSGFFDPKEWKTVPHWAHQSP